MKRARPPGHGLVAMLAALAAACNVPDRAPHWRPAGNAQPHDGGTLHLSINSELRTLDPAIAYDDVSSWVLHSVYATLVDFDGKLQLHARLAARYTIEDAGKTLHFWLRDGITYEDGRPIVAADFKTSLERVLAMPASPFGQYLASIDGADAVLAGKATTCAGIEVRGERELVLHLARPDRLLLPSLAMSFAAPLPADYLAKVGDDLRRAPLASGAFRLGAWDEGRRLVLVRNPHAQPGDHVYLDEIDVLESVPRDTQFLMFERGELDAADRLASADYVWLVEQQAWQPYIHRAIGLNAYGVRMNTRR
ncbi:MAG TPA: ABC transporter substrate-binding protein, partial [Kofleriaceae bacterium]|nr:ABC transporter substrate-binding protein [Kofleriaceae bacterium]